MGEMLRIIEPRSMINILKSDHLNHQVNFLLTIYEIFSPNIYIAMNFMPVS